MGLGMGWGLSNLCLIISFHTGERNFCVKWLLNTCIWVCVSVYVCVYMYVGLCMCSRMSLSVNVSICIFSISYMYRCVSMRVNVSKGAYMHT